MPIHANASVQDLLTTLKSIEEDQTHQCHPTKEKGLRQILKNKKRGPSSRAKPIVSKPEAITDFTSYLIDVVWDGRLWYNCTNLTNDCSRQRKEITCT